MGDRKTEVSFWARITTQLVLMNLVLLVVFGIYFGVSIRNFQSTIEESTRISDTYLSAMVLRGDMKKDYEKIQRYIYAYLATNDVEEREHLLENIDKRYNQLITDIDQLQIYLEGNRSVNISEMKAGLTAYTDNAKEVLISSEGKSTEEVIAEIDALEAEDEKFDSNLELANASFEQSIATIRKTQQDKYGRTITTSVIGAIIIMLNIGINHVLFQYKTIRPIKKSSLELRQMIKSIDENRGDLNERLTVCTKSELSILIAGMNDFLDTLQNIINKVSDGTGKLAGSNDRIDRMVRNANESITESSAALEELAANMEVVSNTSDSIQNTVGDVKAQVDVLWKEANQGSEKAVKISDTAKQMKNHIVEVKELTANKVGEITQLLNRSIQDSEKVSRINALTETILDIASQTTLLSLNASIEAARAGEAGRGFAVVAGEINSLAENSQKTVKNIQHINQEVINAVRDLSENTSEVLEYINSSVLKDYDQFVEAMDEYVNNMEQFYSILQNFANSSNGLNESMGNIFDSVGYIANAMGEGASAMDVSAQNAADFVEKMHEVQAAVDVCREVSDVLEKEIRHFAVRGTVQA